MNTKNHKLLWLTLILSAIFSCKETDTTIGSKLQDKEGVFSHYVLDDLDITSGTIIKNDSLDGTSNLALVYVGQYTDNEIGKFKTETYLQIGLGGDNPNFGTNPVCDSIELRLSFSANTNANRVIQGNGSADNTLSIHELLGDIPEDFANTNAINYDTDVLGSTTFNAFDHEEGYITISLPTTFGASLISKSSDITSEDFLSLYKGLAIVGSAADEAIVAYDLTSANTYIRMKYHNDDDSEKEYYFDMSTDLNHHTYVSTDFTGATFSSISNSLTDKSATSNQTLIQNGTGASTLITIEDFIDKLDTSKSLVVNKAILRLPVVASTTEEQFSEAVSFIRVFETDENGDNLDNSINLVYPDLTNISNGTGFTFAYDETELYYELDLTYYFQEYILGERSLNSFLISPNITNSIFGVNRSIIDAENIVFKLYYSEL